LLTQGKGRNKRRRRLKTFFGVCNELCEWSLYL